MDCFLCVQPHAASVCIFSLPPSPSPVSVPMDGLMCTHMCGCPCTFLVNTVFFNGSALDFLREGLLLNLELTDSKTGC